MRDHKNKIAGAVGAAAAVIIYYAFFFAVIAVSDESRTMKILLGLVPAVLIFGVIYVCSQRIREIKGGEEDDLSKY